MFLNTSSMLRVDKAPIALQWRNNEPDGVSYYQPQT